MNICICFPLVEARLHLVCLTGSRESPGVCRQPLARVSEEGWNNLRPADCPGLLSTGHLLES